MHPPPGRVGENALILSGGFSYYIFNTYRKVVTVLLVDPHGEIRESGQLVVERLREEIWSEMLYFLDVMCGIDDFRDDLRQNHMPKTLDV